MFKIFQLVVKYFGSLPIQPVNINDKLIVYPHSRVPKNIRVSDIMPFAHVSFEGTAEVINSFNVKVVNRKEKGVFKIFSESPHQTGRYTCVASSGLGNHTSSGRTVSIDEMTTTSCTVRIERTDTGSNENEPYTALVIF